MKINCEILINDFKSRNDPKKRWDSLKIGIIVLFAIIGLFFAVMYFSEKEMFDEFTNWISSNRIYVFGGLFVFIMILVANTSSHAENDKRLIKTYIETLKTYKISADPIIESIESIQMTKLASYIKRDIPFTIERNHYYWIDNQNLLLFEAAPTDIIQDMNLKPYTIALDKIKSYETIGEKFYENKIFGGGSEDASLSKAVVGQAFFGTAGAVVGGQQKINPIESKLILHDDRQTKIIIKGHEEGITTMFFEYNFFNTLKEIIPEKDKDIIDQIAKQKIINKNIGSKEDIMHRLELLKKLLDDKVIDETQYQIRKNKIIDELI